MLSNSFVILNTNMPFSPALWLLLSIELLLSVLVMLDLDAALLFQRYSGQSMTIYSGYIIRFDSAVEEALKESEQ